MYLRGLEDVNLHKEEEDEAHLHRIVEEIKEDAVNVHRLPAEKSKIQLDLFYFVYFVFPLRSVFQQRSQPFASLDLLHKWHL